ncbi:MAG: hypothetical protein LC772_06870 [Chloroflexi bacterium]|nr:hypothetical protein [Chloroflexota bacterium]
MSTSNADMDYSGKFIVGPDGEVVRNDDYEEPAPDRTEQIARLDEAFRYAGDAGSNGPILASDLIEHPNGKCQFGVHQFTGRIYRLQSEQDGMSWRIMDWYHLTPERMAALKPFRSPDAVNCWECGRKPGECACEPSKQ